MAERRNLTLNVVLKYLQQCLNTTAASEGAPPYVTYNFGPLELFIPYHVREKGLEMQRKYNFTRDHPWSETIEGLRNLNLWPRSIRNRLWNFDWASIFERMEAGEDRGGHHDQQAFRLMFTFYQLCPGLITSSIHANDLVGDHMTKYPAPPNLERDLGVFIEWEDTYVVMLSMIYMFAMDSWPVTCSGLDVDLFKGVCHIKAGVYQIAGQTLETLEEKVNLEEMRYFPPWV